MLHIVSATIPWMLKLWFIEQPLSFEQRLYVIKLKGTDALQALRVKLNMVVIFDSYHGNVSMTRLCRVHVSWRKIPHHFLDCPVLYSSIMKSQTATTTTLRPGHKYWNRLISIWSIGKLLVAWTQFLMEIYGGKENNL